MQHARRHDGVEVTHLTLAGALKALAEDAVRPSVLVVEEPVADAVVQARSLDRRRYLAATGYLSPDGPGPVRPHPRLRPRHRRSRRGEPE